MLSINISELIWTVINFLLLLFLLRRFLFKPICEHMDARQARIDAGLAKEREAKAALAAEEARLDGEMQTAREQGKILLQQAESQATSESAETIRAARQHTRENERTAFERMQEESRREADCLAAAEPALAAQLAGQLLREDGDGV